MQVFEVVDGNKIVFGERVLLNDKSIVFGGGRNNILYLAAGIDLGESVIDFRGSESAVFLDANDGGIYHVRIVVHNDSAVYIGKDNYMNPGGGLIQIILSEQKHFVMGDICNIARDIWIRNADPHLIYSRDTKERLNPTRSIFIGDHIWIGQNAMLLKGTQIGSGSVIGAGSIVSNKKIPSNEVWAGNPARRVKRRIFWDNASVHTWRERDTLSHQKFDTDATSYDRDSASLSFDAIDRDLTECKTAEDKMKYLIALSKNNNKNRFAI